MPARRFRIRALVLLLSGGLVAAGLTAAPTGPLLPRLAAALQSTPCAQGDFARQDALAIALEEAKRAGFTGAKGVGSPQLFGARPVNNERLPRALAQRKRECLWIVSLTGERAESRFSLEAESAQRPVTATQLRLVVDLEAKAAMTYRVLARR
jgi:hypothetical protein